ncbi:MAG: hypothetical protein ACYCQI_15730, partial [Gammaproteobacteria bacterium]
MESKEPDYKKVIDIYHQNRENEQFQNRVSTLPVNLHLTTIFELAAKKIKIPEDILRDLEVIKNKQFLAADRAALVAIKALRQEMESKKPDYKKVIGIYHQNRENVQFQNRVSNLPINLHLTTIFELAANKKMKIHEDIVRDLEVIKEKQNQRVLEKEFDSAKESLEEAIKKNDINAVIEVYHKFRENPKFQAYVVDEVMSIPHQFHLEQILKNQDQLSEASKAYLPKLMAIRVKQTEKFKRLYETFKSSLNDAERELGEVKSDTLLDESMTYTIEKRIAAKNLAKIIAQIKETLTENNIMTKVAELQQFFSARLKMIEGTDSMYLYTQDDPTDKNGPSRKNALSRACVFAAQGVGAILKKSMHEVLFPTLDPTAQHAYLTMPLGERLKSLELNDFILSDGGRRIVEVYPCLSTAAGAEEAKGRLEHSTLFVKGDEDKKDEDKKDEDKKDEVEGEPKPKPLSESEAYRVINHSPYARRYWEATKAVVELKLGLGKEKKSAGTYLLNLQKALEAGTIRTLTAEVEEKKKHLAEEKQKHSTQTKAGRAALQKIAEEEKELDAALRDREMNSGEVANEGLAIFSEYFNNEKLLPPEEKEKILNLTDATGKFTFREAWERLSNTHDRARGAVRYCIQLIGKNFIGPIIENNKD